MAFTWEVLVDITVTIPLATCGTSSQSMTIYGVIKYQNIITMNIDLL